MNGDPEKFGTIVADSQHSSAQAAWKKALK